jgi:predicted RNA binding protein YcfA (HicA-like mRNA interferase family)
MKYSDLLRDLNRAGWHKVRQQGTSHIILAKEGAGFTIIMPYHGAKEIGKGLEKKIKKQAGI